MPSSIAEVRAHGRVMRYRRLGAGPPLLLLGPVDGEAESLAGRFRVIVPELPPAEADLAGWLTAFLEGLGVTGVTVVATAPFHAAARELALADPDRVREVVFGKS